MAWTDVWEEIPIAVRGATGSDGAEADKGLWAAGVNVYENDRYQHARSGHGLSTYRAKDDHVSVAGAGGNEPEVATGWATHWELFSEGGADGAGSGDVVGPASSTTGNLPTFHDTGGKEFEDSGIAQSAINFNSLTESTLEPVVANDFIKIYVASLAAYRKMSITTLRKKKETIIISAQAFWVTLTNPCGNTAFVETTNQKWALPYLPFPDGASKTYANVVWFMPANYDGGTIIVRFHWFLNTTAAGTVCFGAAARCCGDGEAMDAAAGTAVEVVDTSHEGKHYEHVSAASAAMTIAGTPAGHEKVLFQVYRDPTKDTIAEDVYFGGLEIEYGVTG